MTSAASLVLDEAMMQRALEEGAKGYPSPNPHVGAVVADGDRVVSVGHHVRAGQMHAEALALSVAGEKARGKTLYVTLEPCNHHGRTPPCADAVIASGVSRVVIGCADPAPHVAGSIEKMRAAGVEVSVGVREDDAYALVADFHKHHTTGLPFVTLKAAVTLDGKMATRVGDSKWITSEASRVEAHRMRDRSDAILVGIGTALADDPALTVRHVEGRDPLRVVLDSEGRLPSTAKLASSNTLVFRARGVTAPIPSGVEVVHVPRGESGLSLPDVLRELGRRDIVRLLVEGGGRVHGAMLDGALVDRVAVFIAPVVLGDALAVGFAAGRGVDYMADALRLHRVRHRSLGEDILMTGDVAAAGARLLRDSDAPKTP